MRLLIGFISSEIRVKLELI